MNMNRKQHPIDDLFRQNLTDLEISPTEPKSSGFLKVSEQELKKRSVRPGWKIAVWTAIIVFLAGGIFIVSRLTNNTAPGESKSAIAKNQVSANKTNRDMTETRSVVTKPAGNGNPSSTDPSSIKTVINSIPEKNGFEKRKEYAAITSDQKSSAKHANISSESSVPGNYAKVPPLHPDLILDKTVTNSDTVKDVELNPPSPVITEEHYNNPGQPEVVTPIPLKDSIHPDEADKDKLEARSSKKSIHQQKQWSFNAGVYYSPEWIFNTLDRNKYINNFGLEANFRFGPYSIRTGAGLSINRGYHEIAVETKSYLGNYQELDYITYQWDSRHYNLIPTLHTTVKDIYDTAIQYTSYNLTKQYTYLQIPLILGYDFFYNSRWSVGFRAGPVMSILVKSRVLSENFDPGKDFVVSVNDITPDRIALNWQAMAGVNAGFRISRRFVFELEPNIRYYFDSVYEKKGTSEKPWSLGLRAALLIDL